ncbi:hypothetical protein [Jeotgalibacillus salarius]|uniref:Lipoprotein n=1 Tax=Jeotgalibacillus salarius TaxID=546023 RepID=A0A4Y8LIZ4_9BACL|nr:hypothetical protein [Jeotgalibacillus salarius]TFE02361.1 hypothetical protein E2626_07215 [Jeotgalibacillus salarius]
MKKWLLILTLILLAGCSNTSKAPEVLVFTGESENWRVNYISSQSNETEQEIEYRIDYLGSGDPEEVSYSVLTNIESGSSGNVNLSETKVIRGSGSCGGCATLNKDDVLQFEVEWDGQQESFEVTYDEDARGVME